MYRSSSLLLVEFHIQDQQPLKFILDTGSEISCVRKESLKKGTWYYPEDKCRVTGINTGILTTFEEGVLNLDMGLSKLIHTFHIVTEKFKIPFVY
jgi:hypothetical protein